MNSVLERTAPKKSEVTVFSAVFVIVALGSIFVTLNAKVLGGNCSVFQSVCVLGYCLFPLVLDAIVLEIVRSFLFHSFVFQLCFSFGAFLWSTLGSCLFGDKEDAQKKKKKSNTISSLFSFAWIYGSARSTITEMACNLSTRALLLCTHLAYHHPSSHQVKQQ